MRNNDLVFARSDAEAFHAWLTNPDEGGIPDKQTKLITADDEEVASFADYLTARPVAGEVNAALLRFHDTLLERLTAVPADFPKSRLYIYLAGHGIVQTGGRGAVLFADVRPTSWWGQPLDLLAYDSLYERIPIFRDVILLSDSCRELLAGVPPTIQPGFGAYEIPKTRKSRRIIGYASSMDELSGEPLSIDSSPTANGRGFFTTALLEGLRGKGANESGDVTVAELAKFVKGRVKTLAEEESSNSFTQNADIIAPAGEDIILAHVAPAIRHHAVRVVFKSTIMEPLQIMQKSVTRDHWSGGSNVWNVTLPTGVYRIVSSEGREFEDNGLFTVDRDCTVQP